MNSTPWDDTIFDEPGNSRDSKEAKRTLPNAVSIAAIGLSVGVHLLILLVLYAYTPKAKLISESPVITGPIQLNLIPRDTTTQESPFESTSTTPSQTAREPEETVSPNEVAESEIRPESSAELIRREFTAEKKAESEPRRAIVLPSLTDIRSIVDENASRYLQPLCTQEDGVKKHFYDCENTEIERDYAAAEKTLVAEFYQAQFFFGLNKSVDRMEGLFTDFTASGNGSQLQHQINSRDATYKMMMRVFGYP
jgi:hypothetical protein